MDVPIILDMFKKKIVILICFILSFPVVAIAGQDKPPESIGALLKRANDLKVAEKYEAAQGLYDRVLILDSGNKEALKGKDDCRIMQEPVIPEQSLAVPVGLNDPRLQKIHDDLNKAKTPWDKRRASLAYKRFARIYTGEVYARDKEAYKKKAGLIIKGAITWIEQGVPYNSVYSQTKNKLTTLQEGIHRSWKGHGPDILTPSLETLEKLKQMDLSKHRFRLTAVIVNADLDYDMIGRIDRITPPYPEGGKYQIGDIGTVMGAFTVYKYIGEYEGLSAFADNPVTFHDLLVVKVNDAGIIADAFKYTLEWTDSPSLALYRLGKKGARFKEDIDVKELHLVIPPEKVRRDVHHQGQSF